MYKALRIKSDMQSEADIYYDTDDVHKYMPEVHKRPRSYDLQYLVKLYIIFAKHNSVVEHFIGPGFFKG